MGTARFGKVLTAMVTPFHDDGSLDLEGAAALARWLVAQGNDGLVLAGTTGEAPTLSDDETVELWPAVRAAVDVPLLAGTGSNDTRHTIELSQRAAETGVDGLLVVSPYYNRPPQAGIEAHFRAVAEATDAADRHVRRPHPHRAGDGRRHDRAAGHRGAGIAGLKDARGNPGEAAAIVAGAPDDFDVYSGDDGLTLPLLAVGAVGVIGVATHWSAGLHAEMIAAHDKNDVDGRTRDQRPAGAVVRGRGRRHLGPHQRGQGGDGRARPAGGAAAPAPATARRRGPHGRRPRARGPGGSHVAEPVKVTFLGGLGEIGRNCACIEVERPHPAARRRPDVPRHRHARRRPGAARLHLPARQRRPGRRGDHHARPRGPHGGPQLPAARALVPHLRVEAHPRPGPQPHRRGRPARPHRADPGARRRAPRASARARSSSSP